jgi:hypothetical protein
MTPLPMCRSSSSRRTWLPAGMGAGSAITGLQSRLPWGARPRPGCVSYRGGIRIITGRSDLLGFLHHCYPPRSGVVAARSCQECSRSWVIP